MTSDINTRLGGADVKRTTDRYGREVTLIENASANPAYFWRIEKDHSFVDVYDDDGKWVGDDRIDVWKLTKVNRVTGNGWQISNFLTETDAEVAGTVLANLPQVN